MPTVTRPALLAATATVAVLLAGCGGGEPATRPAPPAPQVTVPPISPPQPSATGPAPAAAPLVDPCALVTKQEAEQLAGSDLLEPVASPTSCTYTAPPEGRLAQVEVYVGEGAEQILNIDRELDHELVEVDGLGEEAYQQDGTVYFRESGLWVTIRLVLLEDLSTHRGAMAELALSAADRI